MSEPRALGKCGLSTSALFNIHRQLENPRPCVFDNFVEAKFGQFSADLHITSLSEFTVYKQSARHPDPVRRLLCLTETWDVIQCCCDTWARQGQGSPSQCSGAGWGVWGLSWGRRRMKSGTS